MIFVGENWEGGDTMDCAEGALGCDPDGEVCDACLADIWGKDDPLEWVERQAARHFEDSRWMDPD